MGAVACPRCPVAQIRLCCSRSPVLGLLAFQCISLRRCYVNFRVRISRTVVLANSLNIYPIWFWCDTLKKWHERCDVSWHYQLVRSYFSATLNVNQHVHGIGSMCLSGMSINRTGPHRTAPGRKKCQLGYIKCQINKNKALERCR